MEAVSVQKANYRGHKAMWQRIIFASILVVWLAAAVLVWQWVPENVVLFDRILASVVFPLAAVLVCGLTVVVACWVLTGLWALSGWIADELDKKEKKE